MAYELNTGVSLKQVQKLQRKNISETAALEERFANKITSVYKAKGSLTFAALTNSLLVKANEGNVYNITDAFTTTADFIEGAGKKHTAGSNVVVVEATPAVYGASSDSTVNNGKTYYVNRNGGYTAITPKGTENPSTEEWLEITTQAVYKFDVHAGDISNVQVLVDSPTAGNFATLNANGQVVDSGFRIATDEEFDEMMAELYRE